MKAGKTLTILAVGFIAGIAFAVAGALIFKKSQPVLVKVKKRLQQRRIDNIPRAKNTLSLSDFENRNDLQKWDFSDARGEMSDQHASSGEHSLKILFLPGEAPAVTIEEYFRNHKQLTDWSHHEALWFDLFNPADRAERIILQIKDAKGNRMKENLHLEANAWNSIRIEISAMWEKVKPDRIAQLKLFLWNNKTEKPFYLDNVKILPAEALKKKRESILESRFLPQPGEKIYKTGQPYRFNEQTWRKEDRETTRGFVEAPLVVDNFLPAALNDFHVAGGIPFGRGQLRALEKIGVTDEEENAVPNQARIVSRWPDGSVRWALIDVKVSAAAGAKKRLFLRYGADIKKTRFDSRLTVKESPDEITVTTGPLQFRVSKKRFYLFDRVRLDQDNDHQFDESETVSSKVDLVLVHKGRKYFASLDENCRITIEERGPLKVCLKAEGWFTSRQGDKFCRFVVRAYAMEGAGYLKVQHTFIYTGYPENRFHHLYKGKKLPENETIDAVYIHLPIEIGNGWEAAFAADDRISRVKLSHRTEFSQERHDSFSVTVNNRAIFSGKQLAGWVDASTKELGLSLGVKNFWQQFPKRFSLDQRNRFLILSLWPQEAGELDFRTTEAAYGPGAVARGSAFGLAKTHELFFYFHKDDFKESNAADILSALGSPLILTAKPRWVADTKVLGGVRAYHERFAAEEDFLSNLFDWGARQVENFHWYGMVDFGDTLSWYRKEAYDRSYDAWGWHPEGRHGWFNCEAVGTHTGALIQFLRTGEYRYLNFGADLARHIMDIDTCHYNTVANDERLRGQIPDDYSRVGSTHRHNADHWGGRNEEASHTNVCGLLLYHYITGDRRAGDVIREMGAFFLSEPLTYFNHPDIAPQRTLANILWGDLLLYELTGDERYKKGADKLAQLFYVGQKSTGSWPENYNPVKDRWGGEPHMMYIEQYTLPALIAYHQLTGNRAIAACIVGATEYVIKREKYSPYFDASSYCYRLTGEKKYLDDIRERLKFLVSRQTKSDHPLWDGMVYQKAFYARPMEFLYKVPFAFDVIAKKEKGSGLDN